MVAMTSRHEKTITALCFTTHLRLDFKDTVSVRLRTVPTIVTAHTFCASLDTRISLSPVLTNTGIFLCGLKLSGESRS